MFFFLFCNLWDYVKYQVTTNYWSRIGQNFINNRWWTLTLLFNMRMLLIILNISRNRRKHVIDKHLNFRLKFIISQDRIYYTWRSLQYIISFGFSTSGDKTFCPIEIIKGFWERKNVFSTSSVVHTNLISFRQLVMLFTKNRL